ncbi:hypothetical protein ACFX12_025617 [Malus domestica]
MLEDEKAHSDMLEACIKMKHTQVQRLRREDAEAATSKAQAELDLARGALANQNETSNAWIARLDEEPRIKVAGFG